MKRISAILLLFIVMLSGSCDNELVLIDEWRNIPIVYGLLSRADEVHYIRVEKAYIDPSVSAFEIAQRPDSIYYDQNVLVEIEKVETGQRIALERVDGNLEGLVRDEGVFADDPNILYRFSDSDLPLDINEEYRLIITNGNTDQIITEATTKIVGDYFPRNNQPRNPINWRTGANLTISWDNEGNTDIQDLSAVFYDVRMRINYLEQAVGSSDFAEKQLEWVVEKSIERPGLDPIIMISIPGTAFYDFLAANLEVDGSIRIFQDIDIVIDAGGQEIFDYINIGQANTGITSSQAIPSYTNLSNGGLGIFSSRNQVVFEDFNIDGEARDTLRDGIRTRNLGFQ